MSKVFFSVTMSLDGFIAPEQRNDDVGDKKWLGQWMELQKHAFEQKFFRETLHIGSGGLTGEDNSILEATFNRTGASIIGKRMFDGGERLWPEDAPFHTPVFVLTHQERAPWVRKGGTTFYFVNDGIESALHQAHQVSGGRDIRIGGGALTICEYLNAGLIDEFHVTLAPVFFGRGVRLFENVNESKLALELVRTVSSPMVSHLFYSVTRK